MAQADAQDSDSRAAPIVQAGAPGQPSRVITAEESVELARSRYTSADVRFMQHMIVHHGQAVEMGDLVPARTDNPGVTQMSERIAMTQDSEIQLMRDWLAERGEALDDDDLGGHAGHAMHAGHNGHHGRHDMPDPYTTPLMPGMLSPAQMDELAAAGGTEFDRLFLSGMIHHHQGALDMVDGLMQSPGAGQDVVMSEFLNAVIADQSAEILRMQAMLAALEET